MCALKMAGEEDIRITPLTTSLKGVSGIVQEINCCCANVTLLEKATGKQLQQGSLRCFMAAHQMWACKVCRKLYILTLRISSVKYHICSLDSQILKPYWLDCVIITPAFYRIQLTPLVSLDGEAEIPHSPSYDSGPGSANRR